MLNAVETGQVEVAMGILTRISAVSQEQKGFMFIGLLVVIAVIALVLSIVLPAMHGLKQQAGGTVCLSNIRQLVVRRHVYTSDNEIVNSYVPQFSSPDPAQRRWVHFPQDKTGSVL